MAAYRESLALAPSVEARSNLGAALAALGRYREAIEAYRGALAMAPGNGSIRYNLALAHYKSDDVARAAEELEALHATQPETSARPSSSPTAGCGSASPPPVEELLRPLVDADPTTARSLHARDGASQRRPGGGGAAARGPLLRGDDSAEAHYLLGWIAFSAGDAAKAVGRSPAPWRTRSCRRCARTTGERSSTPATWTARSSLSRGAGREPQRLRRELHPRRSSRTRGRPRRRGPSRSGPCCAPGRPRRGSSSRPSTRPGAPRAPRTRLAARGRPRADVMLRCPTAARSGCRRCGEAGSPAFGSFTCPQLRNGAPRSIACTSATRGAARFLLVYIREAHPDGEAWQSTINRREGLSLPEARSLAERAEHAALCRRGLSIPYEAVLDGMDGDVEKAFAAFPSRVFVIDREGRSPSRWASTSSGSARRRWRRRWRPRADRRR